MAQERDYYYTLYQALKANTPIDTGNMLSHITLEDYGDYWKIIISGPDERNNYDYAYDVNYNRQRSAKEAKNYKWVERTIRQVSEAIAGSVKYEL